MMIFIDAYIAPICSNRSFFNLGSVYFDLSSSLFEHFLTFWYRRMIVQSHLIFACSHPGISYFSRDPWFLQCRIDFRNPNLLIRYTSFLRVLLFVRFNRTETITFILTDIYLSNYKLFIHIYLYISLSLYFKPHVNSHICNLNPIPQCLFQFSFLL